MRWWSLAGLMAGTCVLAACSDGEVSAPTTSVLVTTTSVELEPTEPTVASTTTTSTIEPTTTAPTTTAVAPTAPPTSTDPTTTSLPEGVPPRVTFPDDEEKQAVVDAAYAFFDAARAAQAAPADEELRAALAETMVDPIASRMVRFLDELVANGERIVSSPDQPTYLEVFAPTVFAIDGSGIFDACAVDSDVRVSGPLGSETVVDDDLVSGVQTYSLTLDGDSWRVRDFATNDRFEGQVGCG